jgi:hypothetical protein
LLPSEQSFERILIVVVDVASLLINLGDVVDHGVAAVVVAVGDVVVDERVRQVLCPTWWWSDLSSFVLFTLFQL